ncbi:MAG: stage III sporulation protein AD [Lachnospiraceae bacterium]|nr:stage III sporulation protein AD [Lachnospiraceae bacterium]
MIKVAVIGVIAVFLAMAVKNDKQEFAMLVILSASLIILGLALSKIDDVLEVIHMVEGYLGNNSLYINILLKMVGITYVAEFSSNLCRDAGFGAVGNQIEFFGKVMIIAVSMPVVKSLIQTISGF